MNKLNTMLTIVKSGNKNSGSWKMGQPRFAWVGSKSYAEYTTPSDAAESHRASKIEAAYSKETEKALESYSMDGYEPMNRLLRGLWIPPNNPAKKYAAELQTKIDMIVKAAKPLKHNTIVYRGQHYDEFKAGNTFRDKGIVSVTLDREIATSNWFGRHDLAKILLPKGTPVVYGSTAERELLLIPNSKFKVESTEPVTYSIPFANGRKATAKHSTVQYNLRYMPHVSK